MISTKKTLMILSLLLIGFVAKAQDYKYHSIFIYNFTKYIQWPTSYQSGDFVIGVLGESALVEVLQAMTKTKTVGSQNFRIMVYGSPEEISKCHMLFVPSNKSKQLSSVLEKISSQSTLVITERPGLAEDGSGINFILKGGKWKFELNKAAMEKAKLKVSGELTRLAIVI